MNGNEAKKIANTFESSRQELGTYWWMPGQEQNKRLYIPEVPNLSDIILPPSLRIINEVLLAPNTQARWAREAVQQGQTFETNSKLIPYCALSEEDKSDVRRSSELSFKILLNEGFQIELSPESINVALGLKEKFLAEDINPYSRDNMPSPVDVEDVLVTRALRSLAYPIAHHQHEDWAISRLKSGWNFGDKRNNELKLHPMLKPTEYLTDDEIAYDLIFALYAIRLMVLLGAKVFVGEVSNREAQIKKLFKVS